MQRLARTLNAMMIFVISGILLAAYYQQYAKGEVPCPLCIMQRLGLLSVMFGCVLNLRFGTHPTHYTLVLFSAMVGGAFSVRQICLNICPTKPAFGVPVWGLSLYTWAFIAFICVLFATGVMLALFRCDRKFIKINWFESLACIIAILLTLSNIITTFSECSLWRCIG